MPHHLDPIEEETAVTTVSYEERVYATDYEELEQQYIREQEAKVRKLKQQMTLDILEMLINNSLAVAVSAGLRIDIHNASTLMLNHQKYSVAVLQRLLRSLYDTQDAIAMH